MLVDVAHVYANDLRVWTTIVEYHESLSRMDELYTRVQW